MARSIEFSFGGEVISAELLKVERQKLYGSISVDTRTLDGGACSLVTLASDGRTLVPHGGTSLGYLNQDGHWVPRSELVPVDIAGRELEQVPSSFSAPIELSEECSLDEFLDHGIRLVYLLGLAAELAPPLAETLAAGTIYKVGFSYRGGVGTDPAFLLGDGDSNVWFLIGDPHDVEWVGLEPTLVGVDPDEDEHPDSHDAGDPLDFGML